MTRKISDRKLPADYLLMLEALGKSYLKETDPIRQSGFGGGPERWRTERELILEAIETDGDLLDVGCANGYLLECLLNLSKKQNLKLIPYGLDINEELITLAASRFPDFHNHFWIGNACDWIPPRKFQYVYTLYDCVPENYLAEYIQRLLVRYVNPKGRLIVGAYGSLSREKPAFDIANYLIVNGYTVAGTTSYPPTVNLAWVDNS